MTDDFRASPHPSSPPPGAGDSLQNALLDALLVVATVGLALLDNDLRYLRVNETLAALNGVSVAEHLGRTIFEVIPRTADRLAPLLRAVLETGEPILDREFGAGGNAAGRPARRYQASFTPIRGAQGEILGVGAAVIEITERHQVEAALRESERRFREILENIPLAAVMLDRTGAIVFCNAFLAHLAGWSRDELVGRNWFATLTPPPHREATRGRFDEHMARGAIWPHDESPLLTRRGETRLLFWNNTLLHDHEGAIIGATSIGEDITERRQQEAQAQAEFALQHSISQTLQRSLLLTVPDNNFPRLEVAPLYQAHATNAGETLVGGDFFDVFPLEGDRVALVVGDASGKGLPAAARTAEVKYALRALLREHPRAGVALTRLNAFLCEERVLTSDGDETFIALALAILDTRSGVAEFAAAAAEPPLLLRVSGTTEPVDVGGLPLGVETGELYASATSALQPGDVVLLVTDGITEARQSNALLGYEGFCDLVRRHHQGAPSLRDLARTVLDGARAFGGGALRDDACLLLTRWQGNDALPPP